MPKLDIARDEGWPAHWRDTGCPSVSESCLTCPLERCKYDVPGGLRWLAHQELNKTRDPQIIEARSLGVPIDEIAAHFEISRRQVFRVTQVAA